MAGRSTPGSAPHVQQARGEHRAGVPGRDDRVGVARRRPRARRRRATSRAWPARPRPASRPSRSRSARRRARARPCRGPPGRTARRRCRRRRPRARLQRPRRERGPRPARRQRSAGSSRYGARSWSGSTSRPLYVPQVGQTRCGRFGELHCGQRFTRGASIECVARRLSRRDLDVFFFGTAMRAADTVADVARALRTAAMIVP